MSQEGLGAKQSAWEIFLEEGLSDDLEDISIVIHSFPTDLTLELYFETTCNTSKGDWFVHRLESAWNKVLLAVGASEGTTSVNSCRECSFYIANGGDKLLIGKLDHMT